METTGGFTVGELVVVVIFVGVGMGLVGVLIGAMSQSGYPAHISNIRGNHIYEVVVPRTATGNGDGSSFAVLKEQNDLLRFFVFSADGEQVENGKFLKAVRSDVRKGGGEARHPKRLALAYPMRSFETRTVARLCGFFITKKRLQERYVK
jgi:hypothetical protein